MIYNSEMLINLRETILLCGIKLTNSELHYLDGIIKYADEIEEEGDDERSLWMQKYLRLWYIYLNEILEAATQQAVQIIENNN